MLRTKLQPLGGLLEKEPIGWYRTGSYSNEPIPARGYYKIELIGGGGGGQTINTIRWVATVGSVQTNKMVSGGGGGRVVGYLFLSKNSTFSSSVGVGGTGTTNESASAGGNTTFQINNQLYVRAYGGQVKTGGSYEVYEDIALDSTRTGNGTNGGTGYFDSYSYTTSVAGGHPKQVQGETLSNGLGGRCTSTTGYSGSAGYFKISWYGKEL